MNNIYVTTPIFYANATYPHIGHLYTCVLSDFWVKANKLANKKNLFLSGMDEHGQKVENYAKKMNISEKEHVDFVSQNFLSLFNDFDVNFDYWNRTSSLKHKECVKYCWNKLFEKGLIYKSIYKGWYSISDENYITEAEYLALENKQNIIWKEEECYYFKLTAFEKPLKEYFEKNLNIYPKSKKNEVLGFFNKNFVDFSVSRVKERFSWGIEVPNDSGQIIYVWLDALCNYLSAIDYPNENYKNYWPGIHFLGKDILKFHSIYWFAILMGLEIEMPKQLIVHGWLLNSNNKISKSLNNAVSLIDLRKKYSNSAIKYYLLSNVSFGEDLEFDEDKIKQSQNVLANKFGNLVMRVVGLIKTDLPNEVKDYSNLNIDKNYQIFYSSFLKFIDYFENYNEFINSFIILLDSLNNFIQEQELWKSENLEKIFYLLNIIKNIIILISPLLVQECLYLSKYFEIELNLNELNLTLKKRKFEKLLPVFSKN